MRALLIHPIFTGLVTLAVLAATCLAEKVTADPIHVVFTYMDDPSTTLTVNWQSKGSTAGEAVVYYDTESKNGDPGAYAHRAKGQVLQIPGLADRHIYRVTLKDLTPGTDYYLVSGSAASGVSPELKVRTIRDDESTLRFVNGGDNGTSEDARIMFGHAARQNPDFAVIGGDMAYADGRLENLHLWDTWFKYYTEEMVTGDGRSIPMVLAIGNHEVRGNYGKTREEAPFFFGFFGQDPDEKSYFTRKFGKNLVLIILDTNHAASHESQVDWLREQLEAHKDVKYKVATYHIPLYPSHREFGHRFSETGRKLWGPLFDEYGLTVGFENHDHSFKRTHLIKGNEVAQEGTLYLGDGCWGVSVRRVHFSRQWYLRVSGTIQHFWSVEMGPEKAVYRAIDRDGRVFDVYPETEPEAEEARAVFAAMGGQQYYLSNTAYVIEGYSGVGDTWKGGETRITLRNISDQPARFTLTMMENNTTHRAEGFPKEPVALHPGEEKTLTVGFHPAAQRELPRDEAEFRIVLEMDVDQPGGLPPVKFIAYPPVRIRE